MKMARLAPMLLLTLSCTRQKLPLRQLECQLLYADTVQTHLVAPTTNPYGVPSVNVEGRFAFRAIYVTNPQDLAGLDVYVYQTSGEKHALVHQVKLKPPYTSSGSHRYGVTGLNAVYDERAREFQYWCGFVPAGGRQ